MSDSDQVSGGEMTKDEGNRIQASEVPDCSKLSQLAGESPDEVPVQFQGSHLGCTQ